MEAFFPAKIQQVVIYPSIPMAKRLIFLKINPPLYNAFQQTSSHLSVVSGMTVPFLLSVKALTLVSSKFLRQNELHC